MAEQLSPTSGRRKVAPPNSGRRLEQGPDAGRLSFPGPKVVHVWAASLELSTPSRAAFQKLLSGSELDRAARFHFDEHRNRYIAAHGWLRQLLACYLSLPAAALEFEQGANGKPALSGSARDSHLEFNMAHSEGLSLVAIAHGIPIGIDVERIRALADAQELVARFFSKREGAQFEALPEEQKRCAFYNLWTRKEAWLKATGEGIGHLLDQVEVSFAPGDSARLLSLPPGYQEISSWSLCDFVPAPGFTAALATAAANAQPVFRNRDPEQRFA